ncbi:MAG: DNA polymerase IV [Gammaproteobacteria bacterium]|nr:DNA polymerase IV [Gammaproteobacteria bacterium]
MNHQRAILHVDMDAFFAAVEQHDDPALAGQPVVVGGAGGRAVVAAASYEARRFGIHSAMPMHEALRRCPQALVLRPRLRRYREISAQVFEIFRSFTGLVEGLSLDEAYLDVTDTLGPWGSALTIAREIRTRIRERTGLTASVGVAHNKLLAKLASGMHKPDGLTVIEATQAEAILEPLPVGQLHGIGTRTAARLEQEGIYTLGQLRRAPESVLWPLFRRETRRIRERAAGVDDRPVVTDAAEKQISSEQTFERDLRDQKLLVEQLAGLAARTAARLRRRQLEAGTVSIKVRRRDFTTYSRQKSFSPPTQETSLIADVATGLLRRWFEEQPRAAVRLLGVGVTDLAPARQLDLFGPEPGRGDLAAIAAAGHDEPATGPDGSA